MMRLFFAILKAIFSLRYRIKVVGLNEIAKIKREGILFLPNHPAEIDPVILTVVLGGYFRPRPLAGEDFYFQKWIRTFMDLVRALPIPTNVSINKWKEGQIEKTKRKIVDALNLGDNFLIYPAGRLKRTPVEQIQAAFLTYEIIKMKPDLPIVLIRTTGLWGSSFSRAPTKATPDFGKVLKECFKVVLKNGVFFTPRRNVTIEMEFAPADFPRHGEKMEINKWLENWYNKHGPEPEKYVSFLFWKTQLPEIRKEEEVSFQQVDISDKKRNEILAFLAKKASRPISELHPHLHLSNDLGLDSLDVSDLLVFLEDHFEIGHLELGQLQTVKDLFLAAGGKKETVGPIEKKSKWPDEGPRPPIEMPTGSSLQEAFLRSCERMGKATACADALSGSLSYKELKQRALILSLKIREMPCEKIGILLPASVGAYVTILATLLAGKVPVMLNWTAGSRSLEYVAELCGLKTILSSYRFISRADGVDLGKTDDLLIFLEEIRHTLSLKAKLHGVFLSFLPISKLIGKVKEEDTAVILFTSGTETLPKGVPLSHGNLLSNIKAIIERMMFQATDISYGVLPPFHTIGFSITGLLPLLAGIKTCYAPDPTNSHSLVHDIDHWKPTIFCCAPGFLKSVLQIANEEQLKSLKTVVTGADKASPELIETVKKQGKIFVEGYGISECSPLVSLTSPTGSPKGVGLPIPHVEICIVDPENSRPLPQGQEGEICINGPNVFQGYIGIKKDPFLNLNGKRWYRSGDRGKLDTDGTLIICGRLKRFVKIGGEMVSLGGLEADLLSICHKKGWLLMSDQPQLAIAVKEGEKAKIILYITADVDRDEINRELIDSGHGSIVKIAEVRKVPQIPLTGTGKVQYRVLDETLQH
jgi:long-chain-fatty-acid--[acyl-carrier-protein] ligase